MDNATGDARNAGPDGYGWAPELQRKGVAFCLRDRGAYGRLGATVFDARLVSHVPLRPVATALYRACADNGGSPPSPEMLEELVREAAGRKKPAVADAIRRELELVLTADLSDAKMTEARMVEWARTEACAQAAFRVAELVNQRALGNGHGAEILKMFQDAVAVGRHSEASVRVVGGRLTGDDLVMDSPRVKTGFPQLDAAMGGGAEPGLHMLAGVPKIGKTAFLTQVSVGACKDRRVAWHISGEVTIRPMLRRVASSMTGWSRDRVLQSPGKAIQLLQRAYSQTGGEILLEYAPGFTVDWMASRLRQIESQGVRVGVIVADFIDLMRGGAEEERRWELERIGKDLRALGVERGVPIWTAKALNRKAVTKAVPTEADLAECFGLVYVVDNLFVLCGTEDELSATETGPDGRTRSAPIIRVHYSVARERECKFSVGAWQRDNDRQRWIHLPHYNLQAGAAPATEA